MSRDGTLTNVKPEVLMSLKSLNRATAVNRDQTAEAHLRSSGYPALQGVSCSVMEGRVVLCGTVPSFYLKQVAQCLLRKRFGSEWRVDNQLEVMPRTNEPRLGFE